MPRKTTRKAGRIDQRKDPFVNKVNRGNVKFETSVLVKSPPIYFDKTSAGKAKTGNENMLLLFFFWGGGHNYCFQYKFA